MDGNELQAKSGIFTQRHVYVPSVHQYALCSSNKKIKNKRPKNAQDHHWIYMSMVNYSEDWKENVQELKSFINI